MEGIAKAKEKGVYTGGKAKIDGEQKLSDKVSAMETNVKTSKKKASPKKTKIVKSGSVCINKYNDAVLVTGQTYDKRAVLKKYKALWNKDKKGWSTKLANYDDLKTDLEQHCSKVDERSIDEYDEFLAELDDAGIQDWINAMTAQMQESWSN